MPDTGVGGTGTKRRRNAGEAANRQRKEERQIRSPMNIVFSAGLAPTPRVVSRKGPGAPRLTCQLVAPGSMMAGAEMSTLRLPNVYNIID